MDDKLKFDKHITKICRKVSQKLAVLKPVRNMPPFELRKAIYLSFIVLHFNYCADSWHFCSKTSATKLEKVNERAIRFVFIDKSSSYRDSLKTLKRPSLAEQRAYNITASIFRTINGPSPACLRDLTGIRLIT